MTAALPGGVTLDALIVSGGECTRGALSDEARVEAIRRLCERTRRTCRPAERTQRNNPLAPL